METHVGRRKREKKRKICRSDGKETNKKRRKSIGIEEKKMRTTLEIK